MFWLIIIIVLIIILALRKREGYVRTPTQFEPDIFADSGGMAGYPTTDPDPWS